VVIEACALAGWVHDLAVELDLRCLVASTAVVNQGSDSGHRSVPRNHLEPDQGTRPAAVLLDSGQATPDDSKGAAAVAAVPVAGVNEGEDGRAGASAGA
jgi:hypothetical protein